MVQNAVNEGTPLVADGTPRRRVGKRGSQGNTSAQGRAIDALQRAKSRFASNRGDVSAGEGIEKVCEELVESERSSQRVFWVAMFFISSHILGGSVTLYLLQGWSFYDCLYFCIVTTTTVGYGDITPNNTISKLYVIYYVIVSIAIISTLLAYLVEVLLDQQEELLLKAILDDDDDEEELENDSSDDAIDRMEASPTTVNQRIMDATRRLDVTDYYALGLSTFFLVSVLAIGFCVFLFMEKLSVVDALYTTVISATTVGFGDFEPTRNITKLIMTVWLCFATFGLAKVIADYTDANVKAKQRAVSRRLLTAQMDAATLKMMDHDKDGSVDKCEFLSELLVRSGKVERKDIDTILLRFEQLDKDKSGEISLRDITS